MPGAVGCIGWSNPARSSYLSGTREGDKGNYLYKSLLLSDDVTIENSDGLYPDIIVCHYLLHDDEK